MRISEAARRLGMSPRMLRYREDLGLLPRIRGTGTGTGPGHGPRHRQFTETDLRAVNAALQLERRYQISPAALAFGLRVLSEPGARAAVADLSRRLGRLPEQPGRALDFEQERALRLLGRPARTSSADGALRG
ncbi:MAG TPA: MerR family DNA-binding transcriptional regulator [Streptosporangiaceae bacterium]|nr:MerR family DNA-binding transcriptional regulator [Streptosporangiaceae bacterium]